MRSKGYVESMLIFLCLLSVEYELYTIIASLSLIFMSFLISLLALKLFYDDDLTPAKMVKVKVMSFS